MRDKNPGSVLQPYLGKSPSDTQQKAAAAGARAARTLAETPGFRPLQLPGSRHASLPFRGRRVVVTALVHLPFQMASAIAAEREVESTLKNKSHGAILHSCLLHEMLFSSV